ncbi:MAG: GGDEF domain-containing protein [Oscillospiraceae bacterium]
MKFGKRLFAYCVTNIRYYEQAMLAGFLIDETQKNDDMLYIYNHSDADSSYDVMRLINFEETDGIIIDAKTFAQNMNCIEYITAQAKAHNVPIIMIDGDCEGCIKLNYDYGSAFEELTEHLITVHGCRKIDMIAGAKGNPFSDSRIEAYRNVLERHGIPFRSERVFYGDFWHDPTIAAMEHLLADPNEFPEAIVCVNDASAIAVCEALNNHGCTVPDDVIVTGFDGIEETLLHYPNITTAQQNLQTAAQAMIKALHDAVQGKTPENISIPFSIRFSQSCGCKPSSDTDKNAALRMLNERLDSAYGFDLHMIHFGDRLIATKTLSEIYGVLGKYSFMNSLVCVNRSFFDFSHELTYNAEKPYDDELEILCHKGDENEFFDDKTVALSALVPENSQNPRVRTNCYVFNAIRFGDITLGYVALPAFYKWNFLYRYAEKYVATLAQAATQIHMREHLKYLFCHDPLTGLYNRRGFFDSMKRIVREKSDGQHILNIYSLDMNDLKHINDTYGHSDGDFAIKAMSQALSETAQTGECYTARFGGDEFVAAIVTCGEDDGNRYTRSFRERLKEISDSSGKPYRITASCGFSSEVISKDLLIDELLRQSDVLMYLEKANYKRAKSRID